jgi:hypothetical protein
MKCEVCLSSLEEYFDGELAAHEADEVAAHLVTCSSCSEELNSLQVTEDLLAQYDREIEISPVLWQQVAEQTIKKSSQRDRFSFLVPISAFFARPAYSFAAMAVLILIAVALGTVYLKSKKPSPETQLSENSIQKATPNTSDENGDHSRQPPLPSISPESHKSVVAQRTRRPKHSVIDPSDVVSSDFGYPDLEDQDTAKHIEQTQNLLRSIRNVRVSESDEEIDVTYDKALSRRLLNENIVLRRDAEMRAKFPTKALLSDLEPILIDIANLPDQAKPEDVRVIKERVQKTEIVAELLSAGLR